MANPIVVVVVVVVVDVVSLCGRNADVLGGKLSIPIQRDYIIRRPDRKCRTSTVMHVHTVPSHCMVGCWMDDIVQRERERERERVLASTSSSNSTVVRRWCHDYHHHYQ